MITTPEPEHAELDHVARPLLPWRREILTECGLASTPVRRIISRDAFQEKVRRQGKKRSAMTTCMTCWDAASRWPDWAASPSEVLRREVLGTRHDAGATSLLDDELRAVEALIAAHRVEFDEFLQGLAKTHSLGAQRALRRRRLVADRRWVL